MGIEFTKMHGLGNDFIVLETSRDRLTPERIRRWADRRTGIGFDQLLLIGSDPIGQPAYWVFNADGGRVAQCGNGARCVARWLVDRKRCEPHCVLQSEAGPIEAQVAPDGSVCLNMGPPQLEPDDIPFEAPQRAGRYQLALPEGEVEIGAVSMGNPHAVLCVEDVACAPVERLGPIIQTHPRFPERVNVGFMQVVDSARIRLRVFERGVGETRACGTGACAAVAIGRGWQLLDSRVTVSLPGGELEIEWPGEGSDLFMTGPADYAFEGVVEA